MSAKAPRSDAGIVAMAYGARRYHREARNLALSLERHSPGIRRALVTDIPGCQAAEFFDTVVPLDGPTRGDCRPKLDLDLYTPYRNTLYVDADCLVLRSLDQLLDSFEGEDFIFHGYNVVDGYWYGDIGEMRDLAGCYWIPKLSSGFMYFTKTPRVRRVFARARELADSYDELGFAKFAGGIADEPVLSIALAEEGFAARDLIVLHASLLSISGPIRIDVLSGRCRFEKRGRSVAPAVPHFGADFSSGFRLAGAHYRRETLKLLLAQRLGVAPALARLLAGATHGAVCSFVNLWIWLLGRAPGDHPVWPTDTGSSRRRSTRRSPRSEPRRCVR